MFNKSRNQTKINKIFKKYIGKEKLQKIENDSSSIKELVEIDTCVILIKVSKNTDILEGLFDELYTIFDKYGFLFDSIIFPIIYAWQNNQIEIDGMIIELEKILIKFESSAIIYNTVGKKGNIGSKNKMIYTFIPNKDNTIILEKLIKLEKGKCIQDHG